MSEKIPPALTAEEWKQAEPYSDEWFGGIRYESLFGTVREGRNGRHAHAALALAGQPFGFTRDHVRMCWLRWARAFGELSSLRARSEIEPVDPQRLRYWEREVEAWSTLRNLIDALLPPENVET